MPKAFDLPSLRARARAIFSTASIVLSQVCYYMIVLDIYIQTLLLFQTNIATLRLQIMHLLISYYYHSVIITITM